MKFSIKRSLLQLLFAAFLSSTVALAADAKDFLQGKQAELTSIVKKPKSAATDAALKQKFDALLDYDSIAQASLSSQWDKISKEQQVEFSQLLRTLVRRAYTKNIRETLDYEISFKEQSKAKVGQLVQTVATHKTDKHKEPIAIDYLMHQVGGSWRVYDILTEGSSLVRTYQSQFKRVIDKKGFDGLLERMRNKAASN